MTSSDAVKLQTSSQRRRERERQALTERILDAASLDAVFAQDV